MELKRISWGSEEYEQMKELRIKTLLEPIGIPASYISPEQERDDLLLCGFENGRCIACCVLTPREDGVLQLRQMAVDRALQGSGLGARLIGFAEKVAAESGAHTLMMHARAQVKEFYEKCGYAVDGSLFHEVNLPHYKMKKIL